MEVSPRIKFLLSNGLKGIIWLAILLGAYFLFDNFIVSQNPDVWLHRFYSQPEIIYLIFLASESFVGIIPPELFMIWAFNKGDIPQYILNVSFLLLLLMVWATLIFCLVNIFINELFLDISASGFLKSHGHNCVNMDCS